MKPFVQYFPCKVMQKFCIAVYNIFSYNLTKLACTHLIDTENYSICVYVCEHIIHPLSAFNLLSGSLFVSCSPVTSSAS